MRYPGEKLVAPVAGKGHLDVARRFPGHNETRNSRRIGEGLIEGIQDVRDGGSNVPDGKYDFVMVRIVEGSDLTSVMRLVKEGHVLVTDRIGLDGTVGVTAHQAHYDARIDAAAQKSADRDIGDHVGPHRLVERVEEPFLPTGVIHRGGIGRRRSPVDVPPGLFLHRSVFQAKPMGGPEFSDILVYSKGRRDVIEREIKLNGFPVDLLRNRRILQQGFDFRGKKKVPAVPVVYEGLDPDTVAGKEERIGPFIPEGESEHAPQFRYSRRALVFVKMQNDLRVRPGTKLVALFFQGDSQGLKIVNLAVVCDP